MSEDREHARLFALDRFREILIVIAGASKRGESSDPDADAAMRQYISDIAATVERGETQEAIRRLLIMEKQIPAQHISGLTGYEAMRWDTVVLRLQQARVALEVTQ